jgi:GNAT superfamily N-acetyltransferase
VEFQHISTEEKLRWIYPTMRFLRPQYSEDEFVAYALNDVLPSGAIMVAAIDEGRVVAAATFRIAHSLSWGKYLYVDDLVVNETERSSGHGGALLGHLAEHGRAAGCAELHLDSGVHRHDAHRFYLRERMDIVFFHFRKSLS